MPQLPYWYSRADAHQCPPGNGAALFPGVLLLLAPCLLLLSAALFGAGSSRAWVQGSGLCGTRALSPLLSPPQASPLQLPRAVAGSWSGPAASRDSQSLGMELFTAPERAPPCHLQVAKNKARRGKFGPAPRWVHRTLPVGASKVGSSAGQDGRGPPGSAVPKANKREGSQHSPIALLLFPVCSWHRAATGVAVPGQSPIVLGATAQPCSQWGGESWPGPHGFLVLLGRR